MDVCWSDGSADLCRAPYDNIVNSQGWTLRRLAEKMPSLDGDFEERPIAVQFNRVRRKRAPQVVLEEPGSLQGIALRYLRFNVRFQLL